MGKAIHSVNQRSKINAVIQKIKDIILITTVDFTYITKQTTL